MQTLTVSPTNTPAVPHTWRRFSLLRVLLGTLIVTLPVVLTMFLAQHFIPQSLRAYWPSLLAAFLCVAGYRLYMRWVEQRPMHAFSTAHAGRELGTGTLVGGGLFLAVMGVLAAAGAYHVTGTGGLGTVLAPLCGMVLVALFEEILFRGILFRNLERALGSWAALPVSALLFGLAHLPNAHAGPIAIGATVVAGLTFSAAYLVTRRLWLAVGMHFAWNTMSGAIFSVPTSGHVAKGFLQGHLSGPDWLAGGAYGIEASVVTLVVFTLSSAALLVLAYRRGQFLSKAALMEEGVKVEASGGPGGVGGSPSKAFVPGGGDAL
ncbi:CPBP family intramembrane glutamic endopeptidase [Deinococcus hopiensis]|uniref:CAAX prenyl protease 2/Lysostaphin resistance protein A-like domain-containing protein n=1 Tax=Deinococcus hopiensis KR-140 TaxID=695939 RepID=A0A1W1UK00_9DEIO|nr:CPBP family intramembrane glutamic endopeptidase [Deinococcus hopiensis]SMB81410.1 hypothetical protein SAMN00790413_04570 [Deinococcus hopiensis KR-140]